MSTANQQAFKVALSISLAIVSALALGWDKAYWSATTVLVMASNETFGHAIRKGQHRFLGSFIGVALAFVMLQFFAQLHLLFIAFYIVIAAVCAYFADDRDYGYLFKTIFTVCTLICFAGGLNVDSSFNYAILRIQETLLGIVCFSLVFTFIWPTRTEQIFFDGLVSLVKQAQSRLSLLQQPFEGDAARAENLPEAIQPVDLAELSKLQELLSLPLNDSYLLRYQQARWQQFMERFAQSLAQLNQAIAMLNQAELSPEQLATAQPVLVHYSARLAVLIKAIEALDIRVLDELDSDSLAVTTEAQSDGVTCLLLANQHSAAALQGIRSAYQGRWRSNVAITATRPTWRSRITSYASRRMQVVVKMAVSIAISFALWVYLPIPGGFMFPMLASIFSFNAAMYPSYMLQSVFIAFVVSCVVILTQFVFLLPKLSEIWQLAAFYFINAFIIWRCCNAAKYKIFQIIGPQMLLVLTMGAISPRPSFNMNIPFTMVLLVLISLLVIRFSMMLIEQLLAIKTQ